MLKCQSLKSGRLGANPRAPMPEQKGKEEFLSPFLDKNLGIRLQKLTNNTFLHKGHIVKFDNKSGQYLDMQSRPVNWTKLKAAGELDHEVLDITQGEIGLIKNPKDPKQLMKKLRTTNASPCVTVIVRDETTCKTMMAHLHRQNSIGSLLKKTVEEFGEDNMDLEVSFLTKKYDGDRDEGAKQSSIVDNLNEKFNNAFDNLVDININWDAENASIDAMTGKITHPSDDDIDSDRGMIAAVRALSIETSWNQNPKDNSKSFANREANIAIEDAKVFAETPLLNG